MILSHDAAVSAFRKVATLREEISTYAQEATRMDLSVEEFQSIVERAYNLKILKFKVPFEGDHVRGLMERYGDRIEIYIKKQMPEDVQRFTAVKEICHVVIDEEEDWSPNGVDTIRDLMLEYSIESDEEANRLAQSEVLAEIAAIELMYPHQDQIADIDRLSKNETTLAKIANEHKIPDFIVSRALTDWYQKMSASVWDHLKNGSAQAAE